MGFTRLKVHQHHDRLTLRAQLKLIASHNGQIDGMFHAGAPDTDHPMTHADGGRIGDWLFKVARAVDNHGV
jgi:hypothetical protein